MRLKSFSILQVLLFTALACAILGWYIDKRSMLRQNEHRELISFQSGIQWSRLSSAKAIRRFTAKHPDDVLQLQEYADSELVHLILNLPSLLRRNRDPESVEFIHSLCESALAELGCKSEQSARELFRAKVHSDNLSEDLDVYPELFDESSQDYILLSTLLDAAVQRHTLNTPNQVGETTSDPGKPDE